MGTPRQHLWISRTTASTSHLALADCSSLILGPCSWRHTTRTARFSLSGLMLISALACGVCFCCARFGRVSLGRGIGTGGSSGRLGKVHV